MNARKHQWTFLTLLVIWPCIAQAGQFFQHSLRQVEKSIKAAAAAAAPANVPADFSRAGQYVALKAHNGKYITFTQDGALRATASVPSVWEAIRVVSAGPGRVSLFSVHGTAALLNIFSGKVFAGGNSPIFRLQLEPVSNSDGTFSLKSPSGKFLSVEPGGDIFVRAPAVDQWEKLRVEAVPLNRLTDLSNGCVVGLRASANGNFFSIDPDDNFSVAADSKEARIWERFRLTILDGNKCAFQAENGNWLAVAPGNHLGLLRADAHQMDQSAIFDLCFGKTKDEIYLGFQGNSFMRVNADGRCAAPLLQGAVPLGIKILPETDDTQIPQIYTKGGLSCGYLKEYTQIWSSSGLPVSPAISVWRPKVPKGWAFVGDSLAIGSDRPPYSAMIVRDLDTESYLAKPERFEQVWSDKGPARSMPGVTFWRPVPPASYVAMGLVAVPKNTDPMTVPSLQALRCVARSQVKPGRASLPVWADWNSGADVPVSLMLVSRDAEDSTGLPPGTFLSAPYNQPMVGGGGGGPSTLRSPGGDWYLAGFKGRSGSSIDALTPVFRRLSDPSQKKDGETKGGNSGGPFELVAQEGYAVGGVTGFADSIVNHFQLQFFKIEGRRLATNSSQLVESKGEKRGTAYSLVGKGCLFQGVNLRTGSLVDAFNLIPLPVQEPWVIEGMTEEAIKAEVIEEITDHYLSKNQSRIASETKDAFFKKHTDWKSSQGSPTLDLPPIPDASGVPDLSVTTLPAATEKASEFPAIPANPLPAPAALESAVQDGFNKLGQSVSQEILPYLKGLTDLLGLENPRFTLGTATLLLQADMRLKLSEAIQGKLLLAITVPLKETKQKGILITADIPGSWDNPVGIKGLKLEGLGFGGNIAINDSKPGKIDPTLFIKGALDIGLAGPIGMLGAFDPKLPGLAGMRGSIAEISWSEILKIANFFLRLTTGDAKASLPTVDFPIDLIVIENASFTIAKKDVPNLDLRMGTRLAGDLLLSDDKAGHIDLFFAPNGTTTAIASLTRREIGPDPHDAGSGPRRHDGAFLSGPIALTVPPGVQNDLGGPVCTIIHSKERNRFVIQAALDLGGSPFTYVQELGATSRIRITGSLGKLLPATLEGTFQLPRDVKSLFPSKDLELKGLVDTGFVKAFQGTVLQAVKSLPGESLPGVSALAGAFEDTLFSIDAIEVKGALHGFTQSTLPEMTVRTTVGGAPLTVTFTAVALVDGSMEKLAEQVAAKIGEKLKDAALDFAGLLKDTMKKLADEVSKDAIAVANEAVKVFKDSQKDVGEAIGQLDSFGSDAGKKVRDFGEAALSEASKVGKSISDGVGKLKFW